MVENTSQPRLKLSKLRDIGWCVWDPIGLLSSGNWCDEKNQSFADEYDGYLIAAASRLRAGASQEEVVDYLVRIETKQMGLRQKPSTLSRANAVVAAIVSDPSIWSWPNEDGRFRER